MADFNIMNVKDQGAIGDGSTDDTNAIQTTISTLYSAGGGIVYMPLGNYYTTAPIISYPTISIVGAGKNVTQIKYAGSGAAIEMNNGANFSNIAKLSIFYTGSGTNEVGILLLNNSNIDLEDLYIDGFYIGVDVENNNGIAINLNDLQTNNCFYGIRLGGDNSGNSSQFVNIDGGQFVGNGVTGCTAIYIANGVNNNVSAAIISGYDNGIKITGNSTDNSISSPRISNCNTQILIDSTTQNNVVTGFIGNVVNNSNTSSIYGKDFSVSGFLQIGSVTSLPTPNVANVGKFVRLLGGNGQSDGFYICEKLGDGTYHWIQMDSQAGAGDMTKAIYDTNGDGIVDRAANADNLGGNAPSYYATASGLSATNTNVGTLANLTTTNKTDLVDAINEVAGNAKGGDMAKATYDTNNDGIVDHSANADNLGGNAPSYYATTSDLSTTNTNIGTLANLTTTNKTDLVDAINEVNGKAPSDATATTKGIIMLAGDLAGTASSPQLSTTGVAAGTYSTANVTVDSKGRITNISTGTTSGGGTGTTVTEQVNDNTINIIKTNFKVSALQNASKYSMKNTVIDDYNDTTGIDASKSSGWAWDSTNKLIKTGTGQKLYSKNADWNSLTQAQVTVINDTVKLSTKGEGNFGAMATAESSLQSNGNNELCVAVDANGTAHVVASTNRYNTTYTNIDYFTITPTGVISSTSSVTSSTTTYTYCPSIAVDSSGTSHIVFYSKIYNASYFNIGYVTVSSSGTVSSITWLTTSTTAGSTSPSIVVDSSGTSHIVFHSQTYNASYYNVGYVTVSSSGTKSGITWLTTNTTVNSLWPSIAVDPNGGKHVVFHSEIYNASYYNIGYITVSSSGAVSGITWLTTSTTAGSMYPFITIDSSGTSYIVFHSQIYNASHNNIGYITISSSAVISGITWLTTSTTADSTYATVAVDSNGKSHVVFTSRIYYSTHDNIGYIAIPSGGVASSITWLTSSTAADSSYPWIGFGGGYFFVIDQYNGGSSMQYTSKVLTSYQTSGTLTGTIDAGSSVTWNEFIITDTLPTNTSVSLTYQTSNDNTTWSASSTAISGTALSGVTGRYLKFVVTLSTTDTSATPTLTQLEIDWASASATVVSTADTASSAPTQIIVDAEYTLNTGTVTFDISIDGGTTWTAGITPDTLTNITSTTGTSVVSRTTLTNDAVITSIGYSWM